MKSAFWISFGFIAYVYVLYPIAIWVASKLWPQASRTSPDASASQRVPVSVCIAARNEAARLPGKIDNLRSQLYPQELIEIIIASDGSTDQTLDLLRGDARATILDCVPEGKAAAINSAVAAASGSILVLTDARQQLNEGAIAALVERLQDPSIGVASGELVHLKPGSEVEASIGFYWRYEKWIRRAESAYFSTVGATGALYAMHRSDFVPLRSGTLLDDFEAPMGVVRTGKRVVFEDRAKAYDRIETNMADERRRKIRTLAGNWQSLARNPWLLSPWANPLWWQYLSHKVGRLLVPFALVGVLVGSCVIGGWAYQAFALGQGVFWGFGVVGTVWPGMQRVRVIGAASVVLQMNVAAVLGLVYFGLGRTGGVWNR